MTSVVLDTDGVPYLSDGSDGTLPSTDVVGTLLGQLKDYLSLGFVDETYSDDVLLDVLGSELEVQTSALVAGTNTLDHPALVNALCRRVARALAMRALPLALSASESGNTFVGGKDPEVRRLEGPWRKRAELIG